MKKNISYKKLRLLMAEHNIEYSAIRKATDIGSSTMTKIRRDEEVSLDILLRICGYLDCNLGDICDAIDPENN